MATRQLEIGFDRATPEAEARSRAIDRWRQSLEGDGLTPVGEPTTRILRSSGLDRIGQYSVEVTGEYRDGDQ